MKEVRNGKRGTGYEKRKMRNGKRETGIEKREMMNQELGTGSWQDKLGTGYLEQEEVEFSRTGTGPVRTET